MFDAALKNLVDTVSARGAILVDWEGESVAFYGNIDDYTLKVMGAYQVIIHNHIKKISIDEKINFFQMKFEFMIVQFVPVTSDYYVLLLFSSAETAPRALYNLKRVVDTFAREIA